MPLKRGYPHEAAEQRKRFGWCASCSDNRHAGCHLHQDDHWEPGDYVSPYRCACPCEGEVREDHPLIELVRELRQRVDSASRAELQVARRTLAVEKTLADVGENVMVSLYNALLDEEGGFNPDRREVERIMKQIEGQLRASDVPAVRQLVAEIEQGD